MMLNHDYSIPEDAITGFKDGKHTKRILAAGTRLYRFIDDPRADTLGKWWYTEEVHDQLLKLLKINGTTLNVVGRSKLAVMEEWNTMTSEVKIRLRREVWAWTGLVRYQQLTKEKPTNVLLMGGFNQVYLPNLTPGHIDVEHKKRL